MKKMSVTAFLLVAVMSLATLGTMSQARGDETGSKLTSKQLRSLIASAKTSEDHQKLAAYYRDMAAEAKANAAEHEKILAAYNQNPSTHPPAKAAGGPAEHCRTLIRLYNDEAKEDLAMADQHDQMAKAASQSQ
ncbi:MAG: hypothetical protein LAN36_00415 [Acidobacteriia bacterium]|nr:hypothetical protein [Terriglobia bacterium]